MHYRPVCIAEMQKIFFRSTRSLSADRRHELMASPGEYIDFVYSVDGVESDAIFRIPRSVALAMAFLVSPPVGYAMPSPLFYTR